jgi:hypothetical protein
MEEDLSINIMGIRQDIKEKHKQHLAKSGAKIVKGIAEDELRRDKLMAKLRLVATIFLDLKIIDRMEEADLACSIDENYSRSLALSHKYSPFPVYLLNAGKDVIVTDSVAVMGSASDELSRRVLLTSHFKRVYRRYTNALEFNKTQWEGFAHDLLDAIHKSIYSGSDLAKTQIGNVLGTEEE